MQMNGGVNEYPEGAWVQWVHIYVCLSVRACVNVRAHSCKHQGCTYVLMIVWMCARMQLCVCECVRTCSCECICGRVSMYAFVSVYERKGEQKYEWIYGKLKVCVCARA